MPDKCLSLAELRETVEWCRLNTEQRELVAKYVELDHNQDAAVKATSKLTTPKSVRVTAARRFGVPAVKDALAKYFGQTEIDKFRAELRRVLASGKISHAKLQTLKLLAKVNGFDASALELPEPEGKVVVEKITEREGKKYRTTVTELPS